MNYNDILNKIASIPTPASNWLVFPTDSPGCYFGKDSHGYTVYMLSSNSSKVPSVSQETKSLRFVFNQKCVFSDNGKLKENVMHILTCKETDKDKLMAFIRLTNSFPSNEVGQDQYYLAKLFSSISALFDKKRRVSESEVQGLFAELYSILYLNENGCDISKYWQSRDKMKFDFSLGDTKRIEIKSTLKSERIHHFRHDQLLEELYDIRIISILLRKCDSGISLADVVEQIQLTFANSFALMLHIESTISQIDNDLFCDLKYDLPYLKSNIRFYDAKKVPHFNEKNPEGVFNAEYDCIMENAPSEPLKDIISWIEEK